MRINRELWAAAGEGLVRHYATRSLRPAEATILLRHRHAFEGRVLEVGCGAGRVTGYLAELAEQVVGLDIAPLMIAECRRAYPQATFEVGDMANLTAHGNESFAALVAAANVLDVFDDAERRATLSEWRRVLRPRGLLVFSSHNRNHASRLRPPRPVLATDPLVVLRGLARWRRQRRNHRRVGALERREPGYALLNDEALDYAILHYYVTREAQAARLAELGFELLECLGPDGRAVAPGQDDAAASELHYVARRTA